jgi:hypothetical protein
MTIPDTHGRSQHGIDRLRLRPCALAKPHGRQGVIDIANRGMLATREYQFQLAWTGMAHRLPDSWSLFLELSVNDFKTVASCGPGLHGDSTVKQVKLASLAYPLG